ITKSIIQDIAWHITATHEIRSSNIAPEATWWLKAHTRPQQTFCRMDEKRWDNAVFDNVLLLIHIINEQVERLNALLQSTLDEGPVGSFHNARHETKGKAPIHPSFGTDNAE